MMKEAAFIHLFFGQIKKQKTKTLSKMLPGLETSTRRCPFHKTTGLDGGRTPKGITADGL